MHDGRSALHIGTGRFAACGLIDDGDNYLEFANARRVEDLAETEDLRSRPLWNDFLGQEMNI